MVFKITPSKICLGSPLEEGVSEEPFSNIETVTTKVAKFNLASNTFTPTDMSISRVKVSDEYDPEQERCCKSTEDKQVRRMARIKINQEIVLAWTDNNLDALWDLLVERGMEFNETNVATWIHRVAKLTRSVDPFIDARYIHIMRPAIFEMLRSFNPQSLSNIVYAYAISGARDGEIFAAIGSEIQRRSSGRAFRGSLAEFDPQALSNIVYAYAISGFMDAGVVISIATEIEKRARAGAAKGRVSLAEFDSLALGNIAYAYALFCALMEESTDPDDHLIENLGKQCENFIKLLLVRTSENMENALWMQAARVAAFFQHKALSQILAGKIERQEAVESAFQKDVGRFLRNHGFKTEVDLGSDFANHKVDFFRESDGMVVEADGPLHFDKETQSLNSQTILRNRILIKNGIEKLYSINSLDWDLLLSDAQKQTYLVELGILSE
ncbi:MAG: RAP domain-containing protein [Simkania sp.]|nr:RAP domain-containing protein [Simkania sp.]